MTRGSKRAIAGYCTLTLMAAAATAWALMSGLARLDLVGDVVQVRIVECHSKGGGRGGSYSVCSGPQVGNEAHTLKIRYDGREGEIVKAVRTPWGGYTPVDRSFVSWGVHVLMPVLPILGGAVTGALALREVRRVRRESRSNAGARSGHDAEEDGRSSASTSL
ncbi:hypothetical protein [Streptomyces sp. PTY087I2]|uniref:hypothetical protein n=1 Tax=Streptomyces sp. PTY087I2 TaxID=1819298 RepID=UPI00080B604E|nr:hypothetical protein [Streptomyces sp. PTY087I2]OCC11623.1 hypothetical protein A3Q37_02310 [Streptomyces sp. PTY087I2]